MAAQIANFFFSRGVVILSSFKIVRTSSTPQVALRYFEYLCQFCQVVILTLVAYPVREKDSTDVIYLWQGKDIKSLFYGNPTLWSRHHFPDDGRLFNASGLQVLQQS